MCSRELLPKWVGQINGKALWRRPESDAVILHDALVQLSAELVQLLEPSASQLIPQLRITFGVFFQEKSARFVRETKNRFPVGINSCAGQ
jgi:hypothetical protein